MILNKQAIPGLLIAYQTAKSYEDRMWVHFGEWEGKYWLDAGDEGYYEVTGVTHWMPLPEPPK